MEEAPEPSWLSPMGLILICQSHSCTEKPKIGWSSPDVIAQVSEW